MPPTQTWNRVNTTPVLAKTSAACLTALSDRLALAQYWEEKGSGSGYLRVGPKSGSAIAGFEALICGDSGAGINSAQLQAPFYDNGDGALETNILFAGIAPDGGTYTNPWNGASNPYGADRFSKFYRIANAGDCTELRIVECDEQFAIVTKSTDTGLINVVILGAIINPALDDESYDTNGRIFGMMTSGTWGIIDDFWNDQQAFCGSYETGNANRLTANQIGCFNPRNGQTANWVQLWRMNKIQVISSGAGSLKTVRGRVRNLKASYYDFGNDNRYIGDGRQWYPHPRSVDNQVILVDGIKKGYTISNSTSSAHDSLGLIDI